MPLKIYASVYLNELYKRTPNGCEFTGELVPGEIEDSEGT